MNRETLTQLRRVVEAVPDEGWDMAYFEEETSCGTVRCAAGWAKEDEWFKANAPFPRRYQGDFWAGIIRIFGLPDWQGAILFGLSGTSEPSDVSKEAVIANIDRLLAGELPIPYDAEV